jgi:hypothetical protein
MAQKGADFQTALGRAVKAADTTEVELDRFVQEQVGALKASRHLVLIRRPARINAAGKGYSYHSGAIGTGRTRPTRIRSPAGRETVGCIGRILCRQK